MNVKSTKAGVVITLSESDVGTLYAVLKGYTFFVAPHRQSPDTVRVATELKAKIHDAMSQDVGASCAKG